MIEIRNAQNYNGPGEYVGRRTPKHPIGSPLANPFKMKQNTREERIRVIEEYRRWLHNEFNNRNSPAVKELHRLADIYQADEEMVKPEEDYLCLICWCAPNPCHAEVIANAVRWLSDESPIPYSWK